MKMTNRESDEWFPNLAMHWHPGALHGLDEGTLKGVSLRSFPCPAGLDWTQAHIQNPEPEAQGL